MGENNTISLLVKRDLKDFSTTIIYKERQKNIFLNSYLDMLHQIVNKPSHTEGKHKSKHSHSRPGWGGSWIGCHPMHQRVAGLISSQDTCPGCRLNPQGDMRGGSQLMFPSYISYRYFSLSLSLSLPVSLKISQ